MKISTIRKKNKTYVEGGFSLLEVVISIFIFLIVVAGIVQIFISQINAYKSARTMQNDVENAQFAINYVAKTLRTSSILGVTITGDDDFAFETISAGDPLIVYDFSQQLCMRFTFKAAGFEGYGEKALWVETVSGVNYDSFREECIKESIYQGSGYQRNRLTTGSVTGSFLVMPTRFDDLLGQRTTKTMGKVTISLLVQANENEVGRSKSSVPIYLQTTVSLRDYPSDLSF